MAGVRVVKEAFGTVKELGAHRVSLERLTYFWRQPPAELVSVEAVTLHYVTSRGVLDRLTPGFG